MITIKYFGPLADEVGTSIETLAWQGGSTDDLLDLLRSRGAPWSSALAPDKIYKLAVNQQICHGVAQIDDQTEVGILPPVTGG